MIGCGVPVGTNSANQPSRMKPGQAGLRRGRDIGERRMPRVAGERQRLHGAERICAETDGGVTISSSTWPATMSAVAGPAPL